MRIHLHLVFALCGLLFLGACSARQDSRPSTAGRFPEQPASALAKTPAQGLSSLERKVAVAGGWGYKRNDAFVLTVFPGQHRPYNTIPMERRIVQARNTVEFSDTPARGQRYAVVDYGTVSRTLAEHEGRMYAVWRGEVSIVAEADEPGLSPSGRVAPGRASSAAVGYPFSVRREYWFDITDTFAVKGGAARYAAQGRPMDTGAKALKP